MTTTSDPGVLALQTHQAEVEQFLYAEADLLDRRDFPGWLRLFTEDSIYWIPNGSDDLDPSRSVSIVYDDFARLSERVWRFEGGLAYAQQPQSRTARIVSNVQVTAVEESASEESCLLHVQAKSLIAEFRRGTQMTHAGRSVYQLVRTGNEIRIRQKKVELITNDGHLGNLSLPL
jgi:benzoate/toluate 1,2-dioxygenase beta subunit